MRSRRVGSGDRSIQFFVPRPARGVFPRLGFVGHKVWHSTCVTLFAMPLLSVTGSFYPFHTFAQFRAGSVQVSIIFTTNTHFRGGRMRIAFHTTRRRLLTHVRTFLTQIFPQFVLSYFWHPFCPGVGWFFALFCCPNRSRCAGFTYLFVSFWLKIHPSALLSSNRTWSWKDLLPLIVSKTPRHFRGLVLCEDS